MSTKTYKLRAFVLRKTKLGEKDLIVSMLDESGMLVRGVAKGARKPGGSLAARLELFSLADLLMAKGRSLDVVCESRLALGSVAFGDNLEHTACAAPIAEALSFLAQPELAQPRLFGLANAAFTSISSCGEDQGACLCVTSAALWKALSLAGFRPSFRECISCGSGLADGSSPVAVSPSEGGFVCDGCPRPADALVVEPETIRWCEAFLHSPFSEVRCFGATKAVAFSTLELAQTWVRVHTGRSLKSLDFLFTSGLF